jgi:hypothetical protein
MSKLQSALVVHGANDEIAGTTTTPEIACTLQKRFPRSTVLGASTSYRQYRQLAGALSGPVPPAIDVKQLDNALNDLADVALAKETAPNADALTEYDLDRLSLAVTTLEKLRKIAAAKDDPAAALLNFDAAALTKVKDRIRSQLGRSVNPPPECKSFVREVNGEYCTVLLTDSYSDAATMEQVTQVLDPLNWPKCSSFFQDMKGRGLDEQGWTRILEVVGTGSGGGFELKTPLKFWKGEFVEDGSKFVNYDMDDRASEDEESDHLVVIDNGYVMATPLNKDDPTVPGVHLFSSKELLIRGVSPTAAAALACRLGWADAGDHMFFDIAKLPAGDSRKQGLVPWTLSQRPKGAPPYRKPTRAPEEIWSLPAENRRQILDTAAAETNTIVANAAQAIGNVIDRWQNGIDLKDVREISENLGKELTRSYQSLFNTALDAVRPATERTPQQ